MARLIPLAGAISLRRREAGFEGLAQIIVGQQVSVASAAAIWARMVSVFPAITPEILSAAGDEALIAAGLSRPKQRALRAAAEAALSGALPLEAMGDMEADEARRMLTKVKGVGPWTADVYALSCIGHADAFAPGDLALQEAARLAFGHAARPNAQALEALAERWRPHRAVAARVLWASYALVKSRQGVGV